GHRGHAGTAADGRGPYTERQGAAARGRPDSYDWNGVLGPPGVDRAALPRGVAIARRGGVTAEAFDSPQRRRDAEISAENTKTKLTEKHSAHSGVCVFWFLCAY